MSRPFTRGCVVARGARFAVVWADRGTATLEILPLLQPGHRHLNDVLLDLNDLVACGTPVAHAVIRPTALSVSANGYVPLGEVPGPTMCRVVQAFIRETNDMVVRSRWEGDRAHKQNAASPPVRLAV